MKNKSHQVAIQVFGYRPSHAFDVACLKQSRSQQSGIHEENYDP